jgi:neutral ceramidase
MILGASQIEITPQPGVELSGFAARIQPSIGVLDPLYAKALYFAENDEKLLWIHCDLIGFDHDIVLAFRKWAGARFCLAEGRVMLSATHTHSGPCTIRLKESGVYDAAYVEFLQMRLREAAEQAMARTEECELVTVEGQVELAVDRRKTASAHTDTRVAAIGFRRTDGTFRAVLANHVMHPVALGPRNRHISADVPGQVALALARQLPGDPITLVTNGACGNLNPPAENVSPLQIATWGKQIADSVAASLRNAPPTPRSSLRVLARVVPLPLDTLDVAGINAYAEKALQDTKSLAEWSDKYRRAVEHWRASLIANAATGRDASHRDAELFGICLGGVFLLGVNAEVFSQFTDWLRNGGNRKIYLVGYANGDMGYLSTRAAYAEGGYEVEVAHLFYGGFRFKPGSLEMLLEGANAMLRQRAVSSTCQESSRC